MIKGLCEKCLYGVNVKCIDDLHNLQVKTAEGTIIDCSGYVKKTEVLEDSGNRTKFDTGAVRDIHIGKGRYDLLPWNAIDELAKHCENGAVKYGERNCEKGIPIHSLLDSAIRHLSCYMRGQKNEPHLRAALWNVAMAIETELNHPDMQDIPNRIKGAK